MNMNPISPIDLDNRHCVYMRVCRQPVTLLRSSPLLCVADAAHKLWHDHLLSDHISLGSLGFLYVNFAIIADAASEFD